MTMISIWFHSTLVFSCIPHISSKEWAGKRAWIFEPSCLWKKFFFHIHKQSYSYTHRMPGCRGKKLVGRRKHEYRMEFGEKLSLFFARLTYFREKERKKSERRATKTCGNTTTRKKGRYSHSKQAYNFYSRSLFGGNHLKHVYMPHTRKERRLSQTDIWRCVQNYIILLLNKKMYNSWYSVLHLMLVGDSLTLLNVRQRHQKSTSFPFLAHSFQWKTYRRVDAGTILSEGKATVDESAWS